MSKYIIEVEDNAIDGLFKAKGFNTLVFDKNGLEKLQKYEESEEEVKEEQSWPQLGDEYWFICGNGEICSGNYDADIIDCIYMNIGNCFSTQEEAEFVVERLKVLAEMRKFAEPFDVNRWDGVAYHYYIYYDVKNGCLDVCQNSLMCRGELYFDLRQRALDCIEAIGEERIKKFYIGVE